MAGSMWTKGGWTTPTRAQVAVNTAAVLAFIAVCSAYQLYEWLRWGRK